MATGKVLIPLLDMLKKLRIDEQQEKEIGECSNRIMELAEQGHILSRLVSKGYIEPAVFIERQNALTLELAAARKKRGQLLDNNGFDREVAGTEQLLELVRNNPHVIEEYREDLFLQSIDKAIIQENGRITFRLVNRLELSEACRKEAEKDLQRHMPMGYKLMDGKIQFDGPKAAVVKMIFSHYLSGISTCALAKQLTGMGFLNANSKAFLSDEQIEKAFMEAANRILAKKQILERKSPKEPIP